MSKLNNPNRDSLRSFTQLLARVGAQCLVQPDQQIQVQSISLDRSK